MTDKTLWSVLFNRWSKKAHKAAMCNPEYAEIESRLRKPNGSIVWDAEAWERQSEIRSELTKFPRYLKVVKYFHNKRYWRLKYWLRMTKHYRQRIAKGYSYRDLWDLDHYLSRVIQSAVIELRDNAHGWPGEPMTFEEWLVILTKISEGFKAHNEMHEVPPSDTERRESLEAQWQEGSELFIKYYGSLWD